MLRRTRHKNEGRTCARRPIATPIGATRGDRSGDALWSAVGEEPAAAYRPKACDETCECRRRALR